MCVFPSLSPSGIVFWCPPLEGLDDCVALEALGPERSALIFLERDS